MVRLFFILLAVLFIGCCKESKTTIPKYKAGDELLVLNGFYKNSTRFIPDSWAYTDCDGGTIVYGGSSYINNLGWVDNIRICETNLEVKK